MKSPNSKKLTIIEKPSEYFETVISQAMSKQKVRAQERTKAYLVDLLLRFMITENFFKIDANGESKSEVLALMLGEVAAQTDKSKKVSGLRRMGDVSLYTAGFFSDSFARKTVDVDYYIGMGRTAYSSVAALATSESTKVFLELAKQFERFVDVLAEISEAGGLKDPKNLLRIYETWIRTGSPHAEKALKEAGIIPTKQIKPDWQ